MAGRSASLALVETSGAPTAAMSLRRRKVKKNPTIRELPDGLFVCIPL